MMKWRKYFCSHFEKKNTFGTSIM